MKRKGAVNWQGAGYIQFGKAFSKCTDLAFHFSGAFHLFDKGGGQGVTAVVIFCGSVDTAVAVIAELGAVAFIEELVVLCNAVLVEFGPAVAFNHCFYIPSFNELGVHSPFHQSDKGKLDEGVILDLELLVWL